MYVTVAATLLVAIALLGYATWLSRRIRRLSFAAEDALESDDLRKSLPRLDSFTTTQSLSPPDAVRIANIIWLVQ
jgi:hypothetical protein